MLGGGDVDIRIRNANFWQNEEDVILPMLPPKTYLGSRDPSQMSVGSLINEAYPFLGLINPLAVIAAMERCEDPGIRTVTIGTTSMYARANERLEAVEKLLDIVRDCLASPPRGLTARFARLRPAGKTTIFYRLCSETCRRTAGKDPGGAALPVAYCQGAPLHGRDRLPRRTSAPDPPAAVGQALVDL